MDPKSGPGIWTHIEILGWIRIRIKRMQIRNWKKPLLLTRDQFACLLTEVGTLGVTAIKLRYDFVLQSAR